MPNLGSACATIRAKIESDLGASPMNSNLRRDLDSFTTDDFKYQLVPVGTIDERADSNRTYLQLYLRADFHRRIDVEHGGNETATVEDETLTLISLVLDPAFWRIPGTVLFLIENPSMDVSDLVRVGNVVSITVTVALAIAP